MSALRGWEAMGRLAAYASGPKVSWILKVLKSPFGPGGCYQ